MHERFVKIGKGGFERRTQREALDKYA